ncbi:interleukin-15 receptor subunit alpha isoform X2 [Pleuronectes platessa]|uniref:interleukin-15 receptor subunit alpha isoform X2 n=1 Tax=Pleuronectes platessa TaxID=8262 RepID=UPI00232A24A2|nr:interleukin-15 receptor subunit alpha isoform X2 [Pleuronectes platessa]
MDPGSLPLSVRVVIVCLLGAARCSSADNINCNCSEIPELPLTKPPPETCKEAFRYTCKDGYVRKAGTSNRITCYGNNNSAPKWTTASLICIPDPRRTTTLPPKIPVTTSFTDLRMTQSGSFSSTGVLEKNSLKPTSLDVQVDHSQATDWTTQASSNQLPSNGTDNPHLSSNTDHTASFTDLRMTQSGSFSSTGVLEKNSLKPTSLDVQVDHSQATDWTTPASSNQLPSNGTDNPYLSSNTDHKLGTTATALSVCASLVIVCALMGITYVGYRRKSQRYDMPATDEEKISMRDVPAELAS